MVIAHAVVAADEGHEVIVLPAQAPQPEPAWPLQLQRQRPGRWRPARPLRDPDTPELDEYEYEDDAD